MRGRPVRSVDHETHPPDTNFPEYRGVNELLAVLTSYRDVVATAWPALYPGLADRAARWPALDAAALRDELETLLRDASAPPSPLRVFWKLAPELRFGGCSAHFASDAGLASAAELVGMDDFDLRLPWRDQGAKYRADDETVMRTGEPLLDIIERQQSSRGIGWVRVGKAPLRASDGSTIGVLGVLGVYEPLEAEEGRRRWMARLQRLAAQE